MTEPRTMAEETLHFLKREENRWALALSVRKSDVPAESVAEWATLKAAFAHAAACVRFVAAIDRAEIRVLGKYEQRDIIGVIKTISANEDIVYSAPTALEAFAKATADTTEGR